MLPPVPLWRNGRLPDGIPFNEKIAVGRQTDKLFVIV